MGFLVERLGTTARLRFRWKRTPSWVFPAKCFRRTKKSRKKNQQNKHELIPDLTAWNELSEL